MFRWIERTAAVRVFPSEGKRIPRTAPGRSGFAGGSAPASVQCGSSIFQFVRACDGSTAVDGVCALHHWPGNDSLFCWQFTARHDGQMGDGTKTLTFGDGPGAGQPLSTAAKQ